MTAPHSSHFRAVEELFAGPNLTLACDLFDRLVSKTASAWESRKYFETKCQAARAILPVTGDIGPV
ncbi:hypothetical protein BDS110ZK4_81500 [Bradyrhizobium diazoefficiens]|jgi:hypothetical protein